MLIPDWDIFIFVAELADRRFGAEQRDAAARNDAFLNGGPRRVHGVLDAILLLLNSPLTKSRFFSFASGLQRR
jgi:hypothetical protein